MEPLGSLVSLNSEAYCLVFNGSQMCTVACDYFAAEWFGLV